MVKLEETIRQQKAELAQKKIHRDDSADDFTIGWASEDQEKVKALEKEAKHLNKKVNKD